MSSLAESEKQSLLRIARRAMVLAVERGEFLEQYPPAEPSPRATGDFGGAFVTLHRGTRLRGCIGQLVSGVPLAQIVAYSARAAALTDPRFNPVAQHELNHIDIELSVLSQPKDVQPAEIEPGIHGLIVSNGSQRGLLLPQVARQLSWSAERFLRETCLKGGLEADAWKSASTRIQAFTAEVFSESSVALEMRGEAPGSGYSSST